MSPEMLEGASERLYGNSIDYWAIGVLAYEMHFGQTPFYDKFKRNIQNGIKRKEVPWPLRTTLDYSDEFKDLIE